VQIFELPPDRRSAEGYLFALDQTIEIFDASDT